MTKEKKEIEKKVPVKKTPVKKRRKKSKMYFGTPAQDAIIAYNECTDPVERSKIYDVGIKYPFEKMAENVMNTFRFTYFDVPKQQVQQEVVITTLNKKGVSSRSSKKLCYSIGIKI